MIEAFSVHAEPVEAFRSPFQQPAKAIPSSLFKFSIQYIDRHLPFPLDELLMKDNCFGLSNNPNDGVSALDVEVCLKKRHPRMFLSGVQFRTRLDSRLKHAGMTVFGKEIRLTSEVRGPSTIDGNSALNRTARRPRSRKPEGCRSSVARSFSAYKQNFLQKGSN